MFSAKLRVVCFERPLELCEARHLAPDLDKFKACFEEFTPEPRDQHKGIWDVTEISHL